MRSDFLTIGHEGLANRHVIMLKNILLVLQTYSSSQWQWVDEGAKVVLVDGDSQAGNSLAATQQHRNRLIVPVTRQAEGSPEWEICLHYPLKSEEVLEMLKYAEVRVKGKLQPSQNSQPIFQETTADLPAAAAA